MKKLNELYEGDRPREKLLQKGAAALRDYELTAVLLGKDVLRLSREIVALFETAFDALDVKALTSVHGVGEAKAAQLLAAIELARRYLVRGNVRIASAADVSGLLREYALKSRSIFSS